MNKRHRCIQFQLNLFVGRMGTDSEGIPWRLFGIFLFHGYLSKNNKQRQQGGKKECLRYELLRCHNQILHIDISFLFYFALSIALSDLSICRGYDHIP